MTNRQLFIFPLFIGSLLLGEGALKAGTYNVTVNTSSLSGSTGSLDFQFNPGVGAFQSATALISNFTGGTGGTQTVFGSGVTGGPIPAAISIVNVSGQDNEVLDTFKFANSLAFSLNFSGPAISAPNGSDTAGSLFSFFIFSDGAGTMPALTADPNGVALSVNVNPNGAVSYSVVSPNVQITPEPASLLLMAAPLFLFGLAGLRKRVRG